MFNFLKRFLPFIFAGILGFGAVILLQRYLREQRRQVAAEREKLLGQYKLLSPIDVVVARQEIPEDTMIIGDYLDTRSIPQQFVQPYATVRVMDALGLYTKVPIAKGEQVLTNKLRRTSERPIGDTLSAVTPEGKRAVTIGIDALSGVGGFVRPSDMVDVLWTFQVPQPGTNERDLVTVPLFQNVQVLGVGSQMVGTVPNPDEKTAAPGAAANTVTLALEPQAAAVLLYAREQGQITLVLRSRKEKEERAEVVPANMATVMDSVLGAEATGPPPKPQRTVEVFKGLERSVVAVSE
jgi:pilus assembly protein CpaB